MRAKSVSIQRKPKISQEVRDRVVLEHLPLVKAIAIRVHENLPVHVDLDDLTHAGVLGLFDAVTKYDAEKNVAFHTPMICSIARRGLMPRVLSSTCAQGTPLISMRTS